MADISSSTAPQSSPTHARLLEVAAALFAERGYGGTSMADIAEGVGVRKASLYNYYDSKGDLLMDLLRRGLEGGPDSTVLATLEGDAPHGERLRDYFRAAVRFASEQPALVAIFRVAATQLHGDLGERAEGLVCDHRERQRQRLAAFFADAVGAGAVAAADPDDLSYVFRMFLNGVLIGHVGGCHIDESLSDERLERVWEIFWSGLASRAGGEGA